MSSINKQIRIGFLSELNPKKQKMWKNVQDGTHTYTVFNMMNSLKRFYKVGWVGYHPNVWSTSRHLFQRILHKTFLRNYQWDRFHTVFYSKMMGEAVSSSITNDYDLLFAPKGSSQIAFLDTKLPVVYHSDATFELVLDYYEYYKNLSPQNIAEGHLIEQNALLKSKHIILASEWAKNSAVRYYGIDPEKITIIPSGADLSMPPLRETIRFKKKSKQCHLLFVGVDWKRKGGAIAVNTMLKLNAMGIDTSLTIIGCIPPSSIKHDKISIYPQINKNSSEGSHLFNNLFQNADFLVVPTRAECIGLVFCEASAFGLPSVTTDTGGVASHVENEINGKRLPYFDDGQGYADYIKKIWTDEKSYQTLRKSTRNKYESDLNWEVWGNRVRHIIDNKISVL